MYEIITIRADYEGWWLFEDYREKATDIKSFSQLAEARSYYNEQLVMLRQHFCNELVGKYDIHAFYNNCEIEFVKIAMMMFKFFIVFYFWIKGKYINIVEIIINAI